MTSSYDHKVTAAQAIVEEHNSHIDDADSESHLSWDDILIKLKKMGGTTEETLREMTWEDIQDCGVPRILARRIANQVFRQNDDEKKKPDCQSSGSFLFPRTLRALRSNRRN